MLPGSVVSATIIDHCNSIIEHSNTMSKVFLLSIAILLVSTSRGWVQQSAQNVAFQHHNTRRDMMADDKKKGGDDAPPAGVETDDPCWQNMLDDDCSMGNIYASNFVAAEWIKSMPCGQGIEVSLLSAALSGQGSFLLYVPTTIAGKAMSLTPQLLRYFYFDRTVICRKDYHHRMLGQRRV